MNMIVKLIILVCSLSVAQAQDTLWQQTTLEYGATCKGFISGDLVAFSGVRSPITIVNTTTGKIVSHLKNEYKERNDWWRSGAVLAISSDGNNIVSLQFDTIFVWDVHSGQIRIKSLVTGGKPGTTSVIGASGDGNLLFLDSTITGASAKKVVIKSTHDLSTRQVCTLPLDAEQIVSNYDGSVLGYVVPSNSLILQIFSIKSESIIQTVKVGQSQFRYSFGRSGTYVYTSDSDLLTRNDISSGKQEQFPSSAFGNAAVSPDEQRYSYANGDRLYIQRFDSSPPETAPFSTSFYAGFFPTPTWVGEGKNLVIGDQYCQVYNTEKSEFTHTLSDRIIIGQLFFGGDRYILSKHENSEISIRETRSNRVVYFTNNDNSVIGVSEQSDAILSYDGQGQFTNYDLKNSRVLATASLAFIPKQIVVSHDGTSAVCAQDTSFVILDMHTLSVVSSPKLPYDYQENIYTIEYARHDSSIVVIGNHSVFMYDRFTGQLLQDYQVSKALSSWNKGAEKNVVSDDGTIIASLAEGVYLFNTQQKTFEIIREENINPDATITLIRLGSNGFLCYFVDIKSSTNDSLYIWNIALKRMEYIEPINSNNAMLSTQIFTIDCKNMSRELEYLLNTSPRQNYLIKNTSIVLGVSEEATVNAGISELKIVPNPNGGVFQVVLNSDFRIAQGTNFSIVNSIGNVVFSMNPNSNEFKVAAQNLANGFYTLILRTTEGDMYCSPLIIYHE